MTIKVIICVPRIVLSGAFMVHQYSGHPLQELKVKKKGVKEMSTNSVTTNSNVKTGVNARYLTMTAMLSAIAFILMFLDFAVPFMPNFIKLDISELPALIGAFSMGPVS